MAKHTNVFCCRGQGSAAPLGGRFRRPRDHGYAGLPSTPSLRAQLQLTDPVPQTLSAFSMDPAVYDHTRVCAGLWFGRHCAQHNCTASGHEPVPVERPASARAKNDQTPEI